MKKSLIFKILYLFLILIVVAGASVFATNTYLASQVSYGSTSVEDALNNLYTLKGNDEKYSIDEQIVGKWIDGKPIYRKVYSSLNTGYTLTSNTWITIKEIDSKNIDHLIDCEFFTNQPSGQWNHSLSFSITNSKEFQVQNIRSTSFRLGKSFADDCTYEFILEYTKTTD